MVYMPEVELIVCSVDIRTGVTKVFLRDVENPDFLRIPIDNDPVELAKLLFEKAFDTSSSWLSFNHYCSRFDKKLILTYIVTIPEEVSPMVNGEWKNIYELGDKHAELVKRAIRA